MSTDGERINKLLALNLGLARREADQLIAEGRVVIDGEKAVLGQRVDEGAIVTVDGEKLGTTPTLTYLMLNKPIDYVCSRRRQGDTPTVYELLPSEHHSLKLVGRLDKNSSGLILLTNDGDFSHKMTHPKFHKTKVYEVVLDKPLQPLHQQMISDHGVMLEDGKSKFMIEKSTVEPLATSSDKTSATPTDPDDESRDVGREAVLTDEASEEATYTVTMHEGRNRQIRRTFAALDYTVTKLHRTTFGSYTLNDLKPGAYTTIKP